MAEQTTGIPATTLGETIAVTKKQGAARPVIAPEGRLCDAAVTSCTHP